MKAERSILMLLNNNNLHRPVSPDLVHIREPESSQIKSVNELNG